MTDKREELIEEHRGVIAAFGDMSPIGNLSRRTIRALEDAVFEQAHTPTDDERGWSTADRREALAEAQSRFTLSPDADGKTRRWADGCVNGFLLGAEWWKSRRTVQGEPTDDEQFAKSFGGWTPDEVARNPRAAAEVIERLRSRVIDGFRRTGQSESANATQQPDQLRSRAETQHKAQGEPSDAQVLAALNAHYRVRLAQSEAMPGDPEVQGDAHSLEEYSSKSIDRMRAALRAATQEGENR